MTEIWTERYSNKPGDPKFCRASVYDRESGGWFRTHQCTRKPTCARVVEGKEYGFCGTHDPEAVEARSKAHHEQWRRETEARNREYDREKQTRAAMDACKAAIEQIAAGHNDPRQIAAEMLAMFPED